MSGYRTGYTLRPRSLNVRPEVVEAALELCLKALGGADKYCVNGMAHSYSLISPMHLAPEEPDRARKGQGARRLSNEVQLGKVACGPGSVDEPRPPRAAKSGVLVGFTLRQVCYETLLPRPLRTPCLFTRDGPRGSRSSTSTWSVPQLQESCCRLPLRVACAQRHS